MSASGQEPQYVQIITTVASSNEGERIAKALLEKRLAACVQIVGPISSFYWWQGQIAHSHEWLCIAKTELSLCEQVEQTIKSLHSYTVPEILAVPIAQGSASYLEWLHAELQKG